METIKARDFKNLLDMQQKIGELNYFVMQVLTKFGDEIMSPISALEMAENSEKEIIFGKYCELDNDGNVALDVNRKAIFKDGMNQEEAMKELAEIEEKFEKEYAKYLDKDVKFIVK